MSSSGSGSGANDSEASSESEVIVVKKSKSKSKSKDKKKNKKGKKKNNKSKKGVKGKSGKKKGKKKAKDSGKAKKKGKSKKNSKKKNKKNKKNNKKGKGVADDSGDGGGSGSGSESSYVPVLLNLARTKAKKGKIKVRTNRHKQVGCGPKDYKAMVWCLRRSMDTVFASEEFRSELLPRLRAFGIGYYTTAGVDVSKFKKPYKNLLAEIDGYDSEDFEEADVFDTLCEELLGGLQALDDPVGAVRTEAEAHNAGFLVRLIGLPGGGGILESRVRSELNTYIDGLDDDSLECLVLSCFKGVIPLTARGLLTKDKSAGGARSAMAVVKREGDVFATKLFAGKGSGVRRAEVYGESVALERHIAECLFEFLDACVDGLE